jgi:hypothetical protein
MCAPDGGYYSDMPREQTGIPKRQRMIKLRVDGNGVCGYAERDLKIKSLTQCEGGSVLTKAGKHEK